MNIKQKNEIKNFQFDRSTNISRLSELFGFDPIRFAITKTKPGEIECDYAVTEDSKYKFDSIFKFKPRKFVSTNKFNAMMIVPTGIGARVGGDSGDANATARLLSTVVDTLITHPNVMNGADINELTSNTFYVEGSILNRLIMGTIGLQKSRGNKVLVAYDDPIVDGEPEYIANCTINTVSAARVCLGGDFDVIKITKLPKYKCLTNERGMAIGEIENLDFLIDKLSEISSNYDSIGLHTAFSVSDRIGTHEGYFKNEIEVNPWGGLEAMVTHTMSSALNMQVAHAPMLIDGIINYPYPICDPAKCPETLTKTELYCILKGLYYAPKIISDSELMSRPDVITNEDIHCIVIPDRCIGLPVLAALEQGIPVIAVDDSRNIMENDLDALPWKPGQLMHAKNYIEAVGMIQCLKNGITLSSIERPVKLTKIFE